MSDRLTRISLMTDDNIKVCSYAMYGRKTHEEMVAAYKRMAQHDKEQAELILATKPEDFVVETYLGTYAQKNKKVVLPSA